MATISMHKSLRSVERPFAVAGSLTIRVLRLLVAWQTRANERAALAGLDDAALKDMGLTRADVSAEADKPFWQA